MRVVVIGHCGHGKSTLIEALKQYSSIECKEVNVFEDLRELEVKREKLMEEAVKELNSKMLLNIEEEKVITKRKKGKELKPWQRTRFYQK